MASDKDDKEAKPTFKGHPPAFREPGDGYEEEGVVWCVLEKPIAFRASPPGTVVTILVEEDED